MIIRPYTGEGLSAPTRADGYPPLLGAFFGDFGHLGLEFIGWH